ncbi:hypothetical protein MRB53_016791 [Persea americana]|uniref:Uncharacterized protein n=1 Tax=Persea americana TaxID=3435 RepID=A0ACC2M4J8_PERAE|nr:hypothetical protein MRB53_016791 [Persea americana]
MVSSHKKDWSDKLPEALWVYRTTVRGLTHSTPFSLVYGCKAAVPLEVQIPSLRLSLQNDITQENNVKLRLQELDNLDERRLEALQSIELYQARMAGSFDKKVRQRAHKKGDLVLTVKRLMDFAHKSKGKFEPKWEGPFVIDKVFSNGIYALLKKEGDRCMLPVKGKFLKRLSRPIFSTKKLFPENLPLFIFLSLPPEIAFNLLNLANESPLSIASFQNSSPLGSGLFFQ